MAGIDEAGTVLVGRYRLGRRVGGGGMGAVHEARDERVGRDVAVKLLHPQLAREKQHVARFLREARAAAALQHPHIVQVLDVSQEGAETPFLVMEYLGGRSLSRVIRDEERLSPSRVARLGRQILSALAAAHEVGIVHRDVKPANLIVLRGYDGKEIAKVVDFGIAKLMDTEGYTRLTATGELLGTPAYMAPEQLSGGEIDGRTDLYGVGAILYAAIAGVPAVGRGSLPEIARRALTGDFLPLVDLMDVHPGLSQVVQRAMDVDPTRRFASAEEMASALAPFEDPTGAIEVPERALPPTRSGPSVRPPAGPIPTTSERPPPGPAAPIPPTSERPPPGPAAPVPITSERPPPGPARAGESGAAEVPARRGMKLALLAFAGALVGALTVTGVVFLGVRQESASDASRPAPVPLVAPTAVVPVSDSPMLPTTPDPGVQPAPDAVVAADAGSADSAEPRRPGRRRRRRPRAMQPPPPTDQPLYVIPADRIAPRGADNPPPE